MTYKKYISLLIVFLFLVSCGGATTKQDIDPLQIPIDSNPEFKVSISHISEAVHGQSFTVSLQVESEHSIEESTISITSDIPTEITQIDNANFELKVTHLYYEEPLEFKVTVTSNDEQTINIESQLILTPNYPPAINTSTNYWLNEGKNNTLLFSIEDEQNTTLLTLEAEDENIMLRQVDDYTFDVNIPEVEQGRKIRFIARSEDEYGLKGDKSFTFGVENKQPYLGYSEAITTVSNKQHFFYFYKRNFPTGVTVSRATWSIVDNSAIGVEISSQSENSVDVYIPLIHQAAQFDITASVEMTNGEIYNILQHVSVIPFTDYKATPLTHEVIAKARERKALSNIPNIDFNKDGLQDIVEFEEKVLYIQLQNNDGTYQAKQKAGELFFTSLGGKNELPEVSDISMKAIKLVDFDGDGIEDLLIQGSLEHLQGDWVSRPVRGWLKGTSNTTFKGDYVKDIDNVRSYFLADYNNDGYIDIINYDFETGVNVSYNSTNGMSYQPSPVTFASPTSTPIRISSYSTYNGDAGLAEIGSANKLVWAEIFGEEPFTDNPLGDQQWLILSPVGYAPNSTSQPYVLQFSNKPWIVNFLDIDNDGNDEIVVELYEQNEYQLIEVKE
ncbi:FG-GAP repeat domain-containing protein [Colwelliaceae bacterium 6471]